MFAQLMQSQRQTGFASETRIETMGGEESLAMFPGLAQRTGSEGAR